MAASGNEWKSGLFGCFDDMETCVFGYFCAPCLLWKNYNNMNKNACLYMCCLGPIGMMLLRSDVREKYGNDRNFSFSTNHTS